MEPDENTEDGCFPCFFNSSSPSIDCGGHRTDLGELLASLTETREFKCHLEYLFFRAGMFSLQPTNISHHHICQNHLNYLTESIEKSKRCSVCVPIRHRRAASDSGLQRVSKPLALGIWEEGQPTFSWVVFGRLICTTCRRWFEGKYSNAATIKKCDEIFEWLYNCDIVHTPTTCTGSSHSELFLMNDNDAELSEHNSHRQIIEKALRESGFRERIWMTKSFNGMSPHSQTNFLCELDKVIQHMLKIFAGDDCKDVHIALTERAMKKMKEKVQRKFGVTSDDVSADLKVTVFHEEMIQACSLLQRLLSANDPSELLIRSRTCMRLESFDVVETDFDLVMKSLSDAWSRADHCHTRRQILAIVAGDLHSCLIKEYFPGVTKDQIQAARNHAYSIGRGVPVALERAPMQRFTSCQIEHFIEFLLSPIISIDLPFGDKTYKLSTGEKLIVPNMIRNMIHSRIIEQYKEYSSTTGHDFTPLSDTVLFAILHRCPSAVRKSLAGLDNISADGVAACDELASLCDQLVTHGACSDEVAQLKKDLHQSKNYLKLAFKMHVSTTSEVPDHCSTFALSDAKNTFWRSTCDHRHDKRCVDCSLLETSVKAVDTLVDTLQLNISPDQFALFKHDWKRNWEAILNWKRHQLRSVHQELARDYALEQLDPSSVFLTLDWAMKWTEAKYREKQSEWYGKKGVPWHLIVAVRQQQPADGSQSADFPKRYERRTICHVFDQSKQDAPTVVSILQHLLKRLKAENEKLQFAYLRCDNGGCYHSAITTTSIKQILMTTGVLIRRIDFSEPQAGKGACDRQAAVIKGVIRRYVDEKHDCTNSKEFVEAAKSTKHLSVFSSHLPSLEETSSSTATSSKSKRTWAGISNIFNIEYDLVKRDHSIPRSSQRKTSQNLFDESVIINGDFEIKAIAWRAFGVGTGNVISLNSFDSDSVNISPLVVDPCAQHENHTWKTDSSVEELHRDQDLLEEDDGNVSDECSSPLSSGDDHSMPIDKPVEDSKTGFLIFRCSDARCVRWYRSIERCEDHILLGKHQYASTKTSLLDTATVTYKNQTEKIATNSSARVATNNADPLDTNVKNCLDEGWALPQVKSHKRFTKEQIAFLIEKYNQGESTGHKWNPAAVATAMRNSMINGRLRFPPEQHLSTSQIKSYFSKLTSNRRQQSQSNSGCNTDSSADSPSQPTNIPDTTEDYISEEHDDDLDAAIHEANRQQIRLEIQQMLGLASSSKESEGIGE